MSRSFRSFVSILMRPSAIFPLAMSLAALALVIVHVSLYGAAPQTDEGAAAHVWQLLMAGQLPLLAFFAVKWLPRAPRPAAGVLALQVMAAISSLATVRLLNL